MTSRRLRIAVSDHYRWSLPFVQALAAAGHEVVNRDAEGADVFLIDLDPPLEAYRTLIDRHAGQGAKVVLYPHGGGGPVLSYDGLWDPYPRIGGNLVTGLGQAEFMRRIEYPAPVHTIGWSFCEMRPFRPRTDVHDVLFAPMHPNADGSMMDEMRELNAGAFAKLIEGPWRVTVRHIGTLEQNGLWPVDGVEFVNGKLLAQTEQIDATDVVVAGDGTFPTLAIARGVPTVNYGQGVTVLGVPGERPTPLRRTDRYRDYIRYPFDVADGPLPEIVHAAARSDELIAAWRRRFVGRRFHPGAFVALVERIAAGEPPVRLDETRRYTTVAFADELAERPELLREYVDQVTPADDASLLVYAPGLDAEALLALTEAAIGAAGLDSATIPDALLAPLPHSPAADAALAERGDALLSDWPRAGALARLPRFSGLPASV